MLCFTGVVLLVLFCFKQETFGPQLLRYKAICFRQVTGNPLYKTEVEASGEASFGKALKRNLLRPWLLVQEPIVISFTFYITIVYIIIFTFFDGSVQPRGLSNNADKEQLSLHFRFCS